jgi:hypothetical protein
VDRLQRRAWLGQMEITLAPREFDLLWHFVQQPGRVFTRSELLDEVWGLSHDGYDHTVNSHINRLRSKLGDERTMPDSSTRCGVWATVSRQPHDAHPDPATGARLATPACAGCGTDRTPDAAVGCCMYLLLQHFSAQNALEASQRMNLGLAQYVPSSRTLACWMRKATPAPTGCRNWPCTS